MTALDLQFDSIETLYKLMYTPLCYNFYAIEKQKLFVTFTANNVNLLNYHFPRGEGDCFSPLLIRKEVEHMTFVEELKKKEREPYKPPSPSPSKEEIEHQKRHQYIISGDFAKLIVDKMKQDLLDDLEFSRLFNCPMEKNHTVRCIYQEAEYQEKECEYQKKYYYSEEIAAEKKERQLEFLKYYLPHCVFDKDEIDCLKLQLQKSLVSEGFYVAFDIKEFKYKVCSGFGLGIEKKSYGYTMCFTIHWR